MSLERLSKLISIGFAIALVTCLLTLVLGHYYAEQVRGVTDKRHQMISGVVQMAALNRALTQLARLYASTGDDLFRSLYNQQSQDGRAFHNAVENLATIGLSDTESRWLAQVETLDSKQAEMERRAITPRSLEDAVLLLSATTYINSEWNFADALNQLRVLISQRLDANVEAARNKAKLAGTVSVVMQLITLVAGLLVFLVIIRRQLVTPLLTLSERIRRLKNGEPPVVQLQQKGLAEVVSLGEALNAYVEVNEELRRQHWVKGRLGELVQALQLATTLEAFATTLQQRLQDCLGCQAVLLFDPAPFVRRSGRVHFSLPILQDGQQMASLELDFSHRPDPAQFSLIDGLPPRVGALLDFLLQRIHNQQLLTQARQQARQLEDQALILQQRQESLEATESWYRGIVEFAPKALLVFDEHNVILANQESELTLGYKPGSLLGQSYRGLVPDRQLERVDHILERLRINKVVDTVEVIARRADGSEFPAELRLCLLPARQGRGECRCVAIRDLSQRKADERRLREAHEQQQAIVTAAPYGIALVQGGVIVQANWRLNELLGYAPGEQLQCSPLSWLNQAASEDMRALEEQVLATLNRGDIYQQQLQLCRKDFSCFWASLSARAISPGNLSRGSIWIIQDITAQHAAAADMQQAQQLAEESARIKSEFLANMSHEIRTPMNAIIGMTHLALMTELNERQLDYLSNIQRSSQYLLGVLNDILDFSKIEAGKLQLEFRDFSLAQLLEEAIDLVRPRIVEKRLDLRLNTEADVPERLCGDPLRLRQILLNFLSNAVKFTERGQIRIEVSLRQSGVDDVLLYFSVTDTGIGLSSEQLDAIFHCFEQADTSITRRFGGTGLGLAIAKQLAELMGGRVGVQSVLGEGSSFWFEVRLQLAQNEVIDTQPLAPSLNDWKAADGTRILLVEDNELNQQVAAGLLQAVNCGVDTAADGREALKRLAEGAYDLVLMDMQMPVLDGLAATRQLRLLPGLSELPIVAISANARKCDHDACLAAGMNDFISKPFEPQTLYTILRHWLGRAPVRDGQRRGLGETLNLDGVDTEAGIRRVLGSHEMYLNLLQTYFVDQSALLKELDIALVESQLDKAEVLAHRCKGVSATIGADAIARRADGLEQAIRTKQPDHELRICLERLSEPLAALLKQLSALLPHEI
ncbi:response regulator [Pseudomonas tussilaginis]|uniref:hybrid sensor histidine kinase/response regulator n=1 Tax=unclassified Pseudomonas TaxID=196821 RepID=UPI000C6E6FBD|nr:MULTISPECIES: ATP-binding protein [unclassified Pseudomonas]QYX47741.1 response regulator [Pseudomonas sp. S11A 273]